MTNRPDEKALQVIVNFLEKNPYTTLEGKTLSGREGALEFFALFFPEEMGNLTDE